MKTKVPWKSKRPLVQESVSCGNNVTLSYRGTPKMSSKTEGVTLSPFERCQIRIFRKLITLTTEWWSFLVGHQRKVFRSYCRKIDVLDTVL